MDGENKINLESNVDDSAQQNSQTVTNNPSTVVNNNTPAVVAENTTAEEPRRRYVDILNEMWPSDRKPMTEEERKAEEKKEKRDKIISAVGDGIMSLSNLFFASRYAPNMFDAQKGMSEATRARWDKLKADREKNNQAYLAAYMNAAKMDDDAAVAERAWQYQLTRDKRADEMQDKQEARAAELHQLQIRLSEGQISAQEAANKLAEINLKYADANAQADLANKRAQANLANSQAAASKGEYEFDGRTYREVGPYRDAIVKRATDLKIPVHAILVGRHTRSGETQENIDTVVKELGVLKSQIEAKEKELRKNNSGKNRKHADL